MKDESDDFSGARRPRVHVPARPRPAHPADERSQRARSREGEKREEFGRPLSPRHGFRYRVDLEYLGTRYSGWQFQPNARTVAGEIMEAIHRATGQRVIEVYGSGRTDAGVHALHQVAHIDLAKQVDPEALLRSINDELPGDINLLKVEPAPDGFHARHSAISRSYIYRISRRRSAFDKPVVWWVRDALDTARMSEAARSLCGLHDFSAFSQPDPSKPDESTKVKVESVEVFEEGPNIFIRIQGSHFLWKMVRRIVGVLVEVGRGNLRPAELAKIMQASGASVAEFTAPPSGLSLEKVTYGAPAPARALAGDAAAKPRSSFRPSGERTGGEGGRPGGQWPRRSASRESPPESGKRTFRRRG